jgi:molecular chaperone GrpE
MRMAEERPGGPMEGEPRVKVTDRRRFTPEGEPLDLPAPAGGEGGGSPEPRAGGRGGTGGAGAGGPEADAREAQLAAQAKRIDELTRAYAALVEDNKSFRQRLDRERARVIEAERASVAQALLEAADDLERALAAVSGAGEARPEALRNLAEGVRLSLGALHRRISALGAERIQAAGQRFDPHLAEAIDTVAVADESLDGVVLQEVRAGYRIGDRVLRPARVRVGRLARA